MSVPLKLDLLVDDKGTPVVKGFARESSQALNQLEGSSKKTSQSLGVMRGETKKSGSSFFGLTGSVLKAAPAFAVATAAIASVYTGLRIMRDEITGGLADIEKFNINLASMAAFMTTFSEQAQTGDLAGAYEEAYFYAGKLIERLEILDAKTIANAQDLAIITETMIKNRVILDITNKEQEEGFINIVNALKLITAGQNQEVQMRQEINALFTGQLKQTDRLAKLLASIDPQLREHLKIWKEEGTTIENVGKLLKGFVPATLDLEKTWSAIGSTMSTINTRILRGGLQPAYRDLLDLSVMINRSLMDTEGNLTPLAKDIQEFLIDSWDLTKMVGGELKQWGDYLLDTVSAGKDVINVITDIGAEAKRVMPSWTQWVLENFDDDFYREVFSFGQPRFDEFWDSALPDAAAGKAAAITAQISLLRDELIKVQESGQQWDWWDKFMGTDIGHGGMTVEDRLKAQISKLQRDLSLANMKVWDSAGGPPVLASGRLLEPGKGFKKFEDMKFEALFGEGKARQVEEEAEKIQKALEKSAQAYKKFADAKFDVLYGEGRAEMEEKAAEDEAERIQGNKQLRLESYKHENTEFDKWIKEKKKGFDLIKEMSDATASRLEDGFTDAFVSMRDGFRDLGDIANRTLNAIASEFFRLAIAKPMAAGLAGVFTTMFPGRAGGGPVSAGSPYVVGERGPELFVPGSSGGILPNHAMGGVNVQIINNSGSEAKVSEQKNARGGRDIQVMIDESVAGNILSGRSRTSKALRQTYGASPVLTAR